MNQDILISGENNRVLITGKGRLRVGNQSVDVSGENNSVVISAGESLAIGGHHAHQPKPPKVKRGQTWQHGIMARRCKVISVRGDMARCLVTDLSGKPLKGGDGKATIQDLSTINMRYAYRLIGGETWQ